MLDVDGTLPQTSRPELVQEMLDLLGVSEGQRVLELGTGSGYSTALLCDLVGAEGSVISLDIDPQLVPRAASLLRDDGLTQAEVRFGDGGRLPVSARLGAWGLARGPRHVVAFPC